MGSFQVRVAILAKRNVQLTKHFEAREHDDHLGEALPILAGRRRRMPPHLPTKDANRERGVLARLGLRT